MALTRSAMLSLLPLPPAMMVLSLEMVTLSAVPHISSVACSSFRPFSSEITIPPVRIAISSSIALRRSPKPGALTAQIFSPARRRFTTSVVRASLSTSSAIINRPLPLSAAACSIVRKSFSVEIFLSYIRMYGFSITHSSFSASVTKYPDR